MKLLLLLQYNKVTTVSLVWFLEIDASLFQCVLCISLAVTQEVTVKRV